MRERDWLLLPIRLLLVLSGPLAIALIFLLLLWIACD